MKLIIAAALLLPITAAAQEPDRKPDPAAKPQPAQALPQADGAEMPNLLSTGGPGCQPIARQIAEESKRRDVRGREARTLDREPPAHLLLAVDRHVDGCRQVTFLRREAARGSAMPNVAEPEGR